jgi:hypothetical protein
VPALIADLTSVLSPVAARILTALGDAAPQHTEAAPFDPEKAAAAVKHLMSLIEMNDGEAADAVDGVAAALAGSVDGALLQSLRDCIAAFDFESAQTKLSRIAAEFHLSFGEHDERRQEAHTAG